MGIITVQHNGFHGVNVVKYRLNPKARIMFFRGHKYVQVSRRVYRRLNKAVCPWEFSCECDEFISFFDGSKYWAPAESATILGNHPVDCDRQILEAKQTEDYKTNLILIVHEGFHGANAVMYQRDLAAPLIRLNDFMYCKVSENTAKWINSMICPGGECKCGERVAIYDHNMYLAPAFNTHIHTPNAKKERSTICPHEPS